MILAPLSHLEMRLVAFAALLRTENAAAVGASERNPNAAARAHEIAGAAGEYVVARRVDRFWNAVPTHFKGSADVGLGPFGLAGTWDVKTTRHLDGRLLLQPENDNRTVAYVLVVGVPPELHIVGALDGPRALDYPLTTSQAGRLGRWIPQSDLFEWMP